jgi:glycosyltransferase involved in cell wall biosynthesis
MISFLTEPNVLAAVAWRLSGMDGALAVSEQTSLVGLTKSRRIAIRFAYPLAREVVAVSSAMADELVSHGVPPDRIRVIPNPTSQQALSSGTSPLLNGSGGPIVVGVGRLVEQKDFATLIRAFEIVQRDQDVRLLILGEGPERQRLEDLAASLGLSDKIEMPGFINNPWPLMAQASVFALSSRWEGWPNVLAEALALGLPVVSTDCPTGPNEILDNGKYGLLVPIQDPPALAAAIAQTLQDPPPSASLQQRAQKWSVENITDQYLQALNLQPTP